MYLQVHYDGITGGGRKEPGCPHDVGVAHPGQNGVLALCLLSSAPSTIEKLNCDFAPRQNFLAPAHYRETATTKLNEEKY